MLGRHADTDLLWRGDKVIAVEPIKDIPEGGRGTVKMVVGQAWRRYLVKWETGEWMGTVDGTQIVREDRVELYHQRKAAEAERAAHAAAAPVAAESGGTEDGGRVPAHLLERSRAARARWEAAKVAS